MRNRSTLAIFLLAATGGAQTSVPASRPATRAESRPRPSPHTRPQAAATGSPEALALARRVHEFAGGLEGWVKVDSIVFTSSGRHRLLWDVQGGKVRIENLVELPPGNRGTPWQVLVYDVAADRSLLQAPKPPAQAPRISGKSTWADDTWVLLAPLRVLDAGVILSLEPREEGDPEGVSRLRLRFEEGGPRARREYVLHVEERTGKVLQWDHWRRAGAVPRSWRWEDHRRIGPLTLALRHHDFGGGEGITLSDVAVNVAIPEEAWTSERLLLGRVGKE